MKNIIVYWLFILIPFGVIMYFLFNDTLTYFQFLICIVSYVFYRIITDGTRLTSLGVIKKNEIWKMVIPSFRLQFAKLLYLNK